VAILIYALAYLLGSLPFGVWVARARGVDIRTVGSGNPGATNVARALGKGAGAAVLLLDVAKGAAPVFAAPWLVSEGWLVGDAPHGIWLGMTSVLGHTYSPWLRMRGGKGVATGLGAVFAALPLAGLAGVAAFAATVAATRIVSVASVVGALVILAVTAATQPDWRVVASVGLMVVYVLVRHRENLARLRDGTEPRFKFGGRPSPEEGP
jgi:glycerol-3-phosphate acyltransferase PlsY